MEKEFPNTNQEKATERIKEHLVRIIDAQYPAHKIVSHFGIDQLIKEIIDNECPSRKIASQLEISNYESFYIGPFWSEARECLEIICIGKDSTLREIALSAAREGNFDIAIKAAYAIEFSCQRDRVFSRIAQKQLQFNLIEDAFRTCHFSEELNDRAKLLSGIAIMWAIQKKKAACQRAIDEALLYSGCLMSYADKGELFCRISLAQAKMGDFSEAYRTAQCIEETIVKVQALCNIAIEVAHQGRVEESQQLLNEAYYKAKASHELNFRRPPTDLYSGYFSTLIDSLQPIVMAQVVLGHFVDAIVTAKAANWNPERASYLQNALSKGLVEGKDYLFCKVCAEADFAKELEAVTVRPKLLSILAATIADFADFTLALKITKMIEWDPSFAEALIAIGKAYVKMGCVDFAKACFDKASATINNSQLSISDLTIRALARAQVEIKDFKSAIQTACRIEFASWQIEVLSEIGEECFKQGHQPEAKEALDKALKKAVEQKISDYKIAAFKVIAFAQFNSGEKEHLEETLKIAMEWALSNKEVRGLTALLEVATIHAKVGNKERAKSLFETAINLDKATQNSERLTIAIKQAEAGLGQEALQTAKNAKELSRIAYVFAEQGEMDCLKQVLHLAPLDKETVGDLYASLAKVFPSKAEEIIDVLKRIH